jgi:hypothetical protein
MFQKLQKMDYFTLKQELLIMQAHKFGKISPTIVNQIFGHLAVLYMKCAL